jgi:hypothetical protein
MRRGAKRAAPRVALLAFVLLAVAAWRAPHVLTGPRFGRLVGRALPATSGHVTIGGGRWSWGEVWAAWRGRPFSFSFDDVHVTSPAGVEVLHVGRVSGRIERRAEEHRLVVRDLVVEDAAWRFDDAGDGAGIRFLAALRPPRRAGPSRGGTSLAVSIPNARLVRLRALFGFSTWGLTLDDVDADASLSYGAEAGGPPVFTFEVRGAEARDGGKLRVGREASAWTLPFSRARLERVATTRQAPDAIQLEASNVVTGASTLDLRATFGRVYGIGPRVQPPGLTLSARLARAPDALRAILKGHADAVTVGGADASLSLELAGPYERLDVGAEARGFAVAAHGVRVEELGVRLSAQPAERRLRLDALSATFPGVGRLEGGLGLELASGGAAFRDVALSFTRAKAPAPLVGLHSRRTRARRAETTLAVSSLRTVDGALLLDGLSLPLWGGQVTTRGRVDFVDAKTRRWLSSPRLDLTLDVRGVELGRAVGGDVVQGTLAFRARVRGPLWGPRFDLELPRGAAVTLLGDSFALPRTLAFVVTEGALRLFLPLTSRGGGRIEASGRVALSGALDLGIEIDDLRLERLPGVAATGVGLTGLLWGKLHLGGTLSTPNLSGRLETGVAALRGRRLGGGALAISTEPSGALRARGQLMTGVRVDGTVRSERGGPRGEIAVDLQDVSADPIEVALPGGLGLRGVVSGALVARLSSHGSSVDGTLSKVRLAVDRRGVGAPAVALTSTGPVALSIRSDGAASLGPARLSGAAGAFEVSLEARGAASRATLRGRLALAPLAPLLSPWLRAPSGDVDVDLVAKRADASSPVTLDGTAAVASPIESAFVGAPVRARLAAGRARFDGLDADVRDVEGTLAIRAPAPSPVTTIDATIGASGRVSRAGRVATATAHVDVRRASLAIPALGDHAALVEAGRVELAGPLEALGLDAITELDVPLRGAAAHVTTPAGTLDRATYALRLRGVPGRTLTLSGDVDVLAARARRDAAGAAGLARGAAAHDVPSLTNPRLDVRVHARGGAVEVAVAHAPDLRVDLELRATGSLAHPVVTGEPRPSGLYSSIVMGLARLLGAK